MTRFKIQVLARAQREYAAALAWWKLNRLAAPNMLRDEFRAAGELLSEFPEAGDLDATQAGHIRRMVLRGSRYLVFYRVNTKARRIVILSVWYGNRLPPDL